MKAFAFLLISAGVLIGSMSVASAQQVTTAPSTEAVGGSVLTPEQIENLNAMVDRMQSSMNDMVEAARETALQIGTGSKTVVLTTNDLAAIAIGSVGVALVVDMLGGGGMATLAGAVVGGVGAHWLVTQQGPLLENPL